MSTRIVNRVKKLEEMLLPRPFQPRFIEIVAYPWADPSPGALRDFEQRVAAARTDCSPGVIVLRPLTAADKGAR